MVRSGFVKGAKIILKYFKLFQIILNFFIFLIWGPFPVIVTPTPSTPEQLLIDVNFFLSFLLRLPLAPESSNADKG